LSKLAATMEEIVQSVNQMATDAMRTSQMTQQGLNEIERGKKYLEQTLDSIDQIHQESLASSQRIMDLSLKMVQIEDVVRIINYVTDHTKILAFNAAIETASAGEVGERFGVVAKEIRQLAQNISDSTEEIKKIINDVKKTAHASVITTEKELKQVNASIRNASDAQMVFTDIHTVIKQASEAVNNISAAINQQRVVHEQVWSSIKDIDSSAKELLKKSQTIVEVTERLKNTTADHQTAK
jgi:methyl-accepting chemotaxis protein